VLALVALISWTMNSWLISGFPRQFCVMKAKSRIGRDLAQFGGLEVVDAHGFRITFRAQLAPAVLEIANQLNLLCINRNGRLPVIVEPFDLIVDVFKQRVSVRMGRTFARLAVCMQAEAKPPPQATNFWLGLKPRSASACARWRWLRLTHNNAASGSPRIANCTSASRASRSPGSVSIFGLRPPPGRRMRRVSRVSWLRNSASPRPIVLRAPPVASATAATPPQPTARAFIAANYRRDRSPR
jgi:hypothetical protein